MGTPVEPIPEELSTRRLWRRLAQFAGIGIAVAVIVATGPGLGELRTRLSHASAGWLVAAVGLEVLSSLAYVVIFRAVFCGHMSWRLSYQIGMSEQGANSVLSVSGLGGLALGAWVLRRGGMSTEQIGRKSVAFYLLTSFPNIAGVILFALLFLVGALRGDSDPALTYGFGAAALLVTLLVLALPMWLRPRSSVLDDTELAEPGQAAGDPGLAAAARERIAAARRFAKYSLMRGLHDAIDLLRRRSPGVLIGGFGTMVCDLAALGACFLA
ncbi:MAG: hypothetical protein FWD04_04965, partial [Conexibacteraceae bacterium]|nr:hypothetical protein [Conexibacteraceae bacterium]